MTDKQLKKLKRADLLGLLVAQSKEIDRLKAELEETKQKLEDRDILINDCGSIAEASLAINRVLEGAQNAAELYLENVKRVVASRTGVDEKAVEELEGIRASGEDEK